MSKMTRDDYIDRRLDQSASGEVLGSFSVACSWHLDEQRAGRLGFDECGIGSLRGISATAWRDPDDAWRAYLAAEAAIQPERVQLQAEVFTPFNPYEEAA